MKIGKEQLRKLVNLLYVLAFLFVLAYIFLKEPSDRFNLGYFTVGLTIGLLIIVGEVLTYKKKNERQDT